MSRVAAFVAGALPGLVLGLAFGSLVNTPGAWMRAHPRPTVTTAPWEPAPDTTRSPDPVEHEIEGLKREFPKATEAELDELRKTLRVRAKT